MSTTAATAAARQSLHNRSRRALLDGPSLMRARVLQLPVPGSGRTITAPRCYPPRAERAMQRKPRCAAEVSTICAWRAAGR